MKIIFGCVVIAILIITNCYENTTIKEEDTSLNCNSEISIESSEYVCS